MADISKCLNMECPSRHKCYRYRAIGSDQRQSFAGFQHDPKIGRCDYFWNIQGFHDTQLLTISDADRVVMRIKK